MSARCRWCHGDGAISVERGSSLRYRCPDCNGSGLRFSVAELDHDRAVDLADDLAAEQAVAKGGAA